MTRWKLTLEYDGTNFSGWQKQDNAPSIQQNLEEAIKKFSGQVVTLFASGRTDAGVHARAQVVHTDIDKETNGDVIRDAINFYLRPSRIAVIKAEQVDGNFHARFSAVQRTYYYRIINRRAPLTYQSDYAWHVIKPLDISSMKRAAQLLIGTHDFSTFRARDCQAKSPIKTLDRLDIDFQDDEIIIYAAARSFLYHQVRNMVGTLALVGTQTWSIDNFVTAVKACNRTSGGPTAPPHGLYFWQVTYP